jgi:LacI family transcriptional regulator
METKTKRPEYAYRIALLTEAESLLSQRVLYGLCHRAIAYPHISVQRFFLSRLFDKGIGDLVDWQPEALVINCADIQFLKSIRKAMPQAPVVVTYAVAPGLADAAVGTKAEEVLDLALKHFSSNGLTHFALFYAGTATPASKQADQFRELIQQDTGTFSSFQRDIQIEDLLRAPEGEALQKTGEWLQSLPKPVGIFSSTCHSAAYLVRVCKLLKLNIPQQIQIIGSDELDESLECSPHLTSIHMPAERVGATALETAIQLLRKEKAVPPVQLIEGASLIPQGSTGIVISELSNIPAAIAYIESHATQGITVDDVLHQTQYVSRMTFYREFKKLTGDSPANYIKRIQLESACRLLSTTPLDITRIAELAGFSSSNAFARIFRKKTGMSPLQYRKSKTNSK